VFLEATMKRLVLAGAVLGMIGGAALGAQTNRAATGTVLGTVHLTQQVMADGKPLAAGTYQVRLTSDEVKTAVGENPDAEKYVEFVRGGKVAGREVATIISAEDIGKIAKGKKPHANSSSVETLKGGDFVRVWINKGGTNYLINMPPGGKAKG
jgi:hypothetical protein